MKPDSPIFHTKHVFRAGFLFLLGVVGLVILRSLMAPDTWGQYGPYRGASVGEYLQLPVMHGGKESCRECHEDEYDVHESGPHAKLECELCHAPVAMHVKDGSWEAEMPRPESSEFCLQCHQLLVSRPAGFPQIQPKRHVEEMGEEYGPRVCFTCHEAHSPY